MEKLDDVSDYEQLRLMLAFFKIKDAQRRREVIDLVERLASNHSLLMQDNDQKPNSN